MSPQRSYFQSWDRKLKVVDRTSRRSKVKYIIDPPRYEDKLADVMTDELEILITGQMRDVIPGTCNQPDPKVDRNNAICRPVARCFG